MQQAHATVARLSVNNMAHLATGNTVSVAARASLLLGLICAAGCSDTLPPAADPDRARTALQTVLQAWKNGEKIESLAQRDEAIHVNDPDWRSGKRLQAYEVKPGQPNGQSWRCEVLLTVQEGESKPRERRASYSVDTDPAVVVVREP